MKGYLVADLDHLSCSLETEAVFRSKFWIQTSNFFHHINLSYIHNFSVISYQFQPKLSTLEGTKHSLRSLPMLLLLK